MAVITTAVAAVASAGAAIYGAYSSKQAADAALAQMSDEEAANYRQAQSIDDQITREADLHGEEEGLLQAENEIASDKLDLANRKAVSELGYKGEELTQAGEKSEEGLKSGLEKTLMAGATSFKQAGAQQTSAMAASGFAGAGVGQQAGMRDAMAQIQMAQQSQTTAYGQEKSMLEMEGRKLDTAGEYQKESSALATDALEQQYERDKFGASKEYERAVGALEARQQELAPGYEATA